MSVDPTTQEAGQAGATAKSTAQQGKTSGKQQGDTGKPSASQQDSASQQASQQDAGDEQGGGEADKSKRGRPRKQSTARKTRSVELVLTVTGTMDGDWQADLKHGNEKVVQGLQIPASAVSRAAKELHEQISDGIETVLGAAREQHRSRLEELEAEMQKVKAALAELEE